MTVIINGTTGITNVNGTAAAPAETGTDTDSGIVYGTNTVSLATNGTTAVTVDASQNVGIGTASPSSMSGTGLQVGASSIFENVASSQTLVGGNAYYTGSAWKAVRTQTGYAAMRQNAIGPGVTSFHQNVASYTAGDTLTAMDTTDVRMVIDASGNVGIGTSSPSALLHVASGSNPVLNYQTGTWAAKIFQQNDATAYNGLIVGNRYADTSSTVFEAGSLYGSSTAWGSFYKITGNGLHFWGTGNSGTERMRLDGSGNLLVATTSAPSGTQTGYAIGATTGISGSTSGNFSLGLYRLGNDGQVAQFYRAATNVGSISVTGSATAYNTSSDYRLKDITGSLTGAKDFIMALQPKQGTWKADGSKFVGFLAHEFQEVSPSSVVGDKDAVDADGKPIMQAMQASSSEVMANLVAFIQEQQALITALTERITALETK